MTANSPTTQKNLTIGRKVLAEATRLDAWADKAGTEADLALVYRKDANDLRDVGNAICRGELEHAERMAMNLDTAVRDFLPRELGQLEAFAEWSWGREWSAASKTESPTS